jgi:hypothetical protein
VIGKPRLHRKKLSEIKKGSHYERVFICKPNDAVEGKLHNWLVGFWVGGCRPFVCCSATNLSIARKISLWLAIDELIEDKSWGVE